MRSHCHRTFLVLASISALLALTSRGQDLNSALPSSTTTPIPMVTPPPAPTVPPLTANPQFAKAIILYGQDASVALSNDAGRFQKVALQQGEAVTVVMTFTALDFGQAADVQVLDGGSIGAVIAIPKGMVPPTPTPSGTPPIQSAPQPSPSVAPGPCYPDTVTACVPDTSTLIDSGRILLVSPAGLLTFSFKPGAGPGLHRVSVIVNGNQYILQFWQQDPAHPNNNLSMAKAY